MTRLFSSSARSAFLALVVGTVAFVPVPAGGAEPAPSGGACSLDAEGAKTTQDRGYWLAGADGGVYSFGQAPFFGSMAATRLNGPVVAIEEDPELGYWLTDGEGRVRNAGYGGLGGTGRQQLNAPIVGLAAHASGDGYWLAAADGGVFAFGEAPFLGSLGGQRLNAPVVGIEPTTTGRGYWLVAADGGVFAFGDAPFLGSMAGRPLNARIIGMAACHGEGPDSFFSPH